MFQLLRPVGEKVIIPGEGSPGSATPFKMKGYKTTFVNSGTAALGLALSLLRKASPEKKQVIIPAYCCPDILSAVLFNELEPVFVDLEPNSTFLDLDKVTLALNSQSLAIVAINFLGVPERVEALKNRGAAFGVKIIEDSAQFMPLDKNSTGFKGDMVVLSFGKGKPLSLLGGGAVLISDGVEPENKASSSLVDTFNITNKLKLKVRLYNFILRPYVYWVLSKIPLLKIGSTHFKPLTEITYFQGLDSILNLNMEYRKRNDFKCIELLRRRLASLESENIIDLSLKYNVPVSSLLRYPILLKNKASRDELLSRLNEVGVSATAMYKNKLIDVPGVPQECLDGCMVGASVAGDFAGRLLTIPSHSGVDLEWVEKIVKVIGVYA